MTPSEGQCILWENWSKASPELEEHLRKRYMSIIPTPKEPYFSYQKTKLGRRKNVT